MAELYRVLKPRGWGIIMVPINLVIPEIDEGPQVTDIAERWRRFGQDDHVHLYNKTGFIRRLEGAGFIVHQLGNEYFGESAFNKYRITDRSVLYIAKNKDSKGAVAGVDRFRRGQSIAKPCVFSGCISMIITKDFVMLNFPKTGSTFARRTIKQLYARRETSFRKLFNGLGLSQPDIIELMMPNVDEAITYISQHQHGTLRQIPPEHRNKPIMSITRSPFSRYESTYLFRWWEKYPPADPQKIREKFPNFPKLSFSEYYEMIHDFGRENRLQGIMPNIELGYHTIQFIQFYFREPETVLKKIDGDYIESQKYKEDMGKIYFIHQESLRKELKQFLIHIGIPQHEVEFIDSLRKVNVTDKRMVNTDPQINTDNPSVRKRILAREKLIFSIFPEYLHDMIRPNKTKI